MEAETTWQQGPLPSILAALSSGESGVPSCQLGSPRKSPLFFSQISSLCADGVKA